MIFGFPTLHASGDPYWDSVLLLLKMQGADASLIVTDSSKYADSKVCNTGMEISTADKKWGASSLLVSQQTPLGLLWDNTRFARNSGEPFTFEGWFKSVAEVSSVTSTPLIMSLDSAANGLLLRFSKWSGGSRVGVRLNVGDTFDPYTYTPESDGWNYWMIRVAADGTTQCWINTTLVHSSGNPGDWLTSGKFYLCGYSSAGSTSPITCYLGETRVTKADRYPSGIASLPSEFPVG